MTYEDLISRIEAASGSGRAALERLSLYVSAGGEVLPEYEPYLADATTYHEFFDAIYRDDERRFTNVWAEWASLSCKKWIARFEPTLAIENLRLKSDGIPLQFGTGVVLAPTGCRGNIANLYVFASGAFNTEAAQFVTSVGGTFDCVGYRFAGIYGLYSYRGSVILEAWEEERPPEPSPAGT